MQIGEELRVHEVAEIVTCERLIVVDLAVPILGCGPAFPAVGLIEDVGIPLALEGRLSAPVLLQILKVLEEE
jgi:hypothetical protein